MKHLWNCAVLALTTGIFTAPVFAHVEDDAHVHAWLDGMVLPVSDGALLLAALLVAALLVWRFAKRR